jgi:hypothetical protein
MTLRLAVFSGPRNISTAMMRAWENRPDCAVVDEPFYAYYLAATGVDHPGRDEVIASGETDWRRVVASLVGPVPGGRAIHYQKHMTHHMLPAIDRAWLRATTPVFLIRDPREALVSYVKARPDVTPEDLGVPQESALVDYVAEYSGAWPLVIDTGDFLERPEAHLRAWCAKLGIAFLPQMLRWPAGPRDTDGVWAPHWYDAVWRSTGFEPRPHRDDVEIPERYRAVVDACLPHYERLRAQRLVA